MKRPTAKTHHDIKPAPMRVAIPVRRVVDFTPSRVKQYRSNTQKLALRRSFTRLIGSLCIVAMLFSYGSWGETTSYYNDVEQARANNFTAGLVDFILIDTPFETFASTTDWEVEVEPNDFSNPFYYYASSTDFTGNIELCEALTVTATLDGQVMYQGLLSELLTATTTVIDTWMFDFDNFEQFTGQSCMFAIEYNGWQTRHDMDQGGYSDTERVKYMITVPSLLLTKVYFTQGCEVDPGVSATSSNQCVPTQTWVEIYNRTDGVIDTQGWSLCNRDGCFELTQAIGIPAGEFAIVAADPEIHTEISLPLGVAPIITYGPWFSSDLDSAGDVLQLRDESDIVIDQLNWGISTSSWSNYPDDLWADDSLMATTGHALARIPIGFDTNEPEDWVLLGVPTLVIDTFETPIQAGATTTITYTAINMNGLNDELKIDVYLFDRDLNLYVIELDVDTTGEYSFVVPPDIEGPVRIKLVATNPENILLNARFLTEEIPLVDSSAAQASRGDREFVSLQTVQSATTTATSTDVTEELDTEDDEGTRGGGGGGTNNPSVTTATTTETELTTATTTAATTTTPELPVDESATTTATATVAEVVEEAATSTEQVIEPETLLEAAEEEDEVLVEDDLKLDETAKEEDKEVAEDVEIEVIELVEEVIEAESETVQEAEE